MTCVEYHNPLDVLFFSCSYDNHARCMHDSKKIYEVLYDNISLPATMINIINDYNDVLSMQYALHEYYILSRIMNSLFLRPTIVKTNSIYF